MSDVDDRLPVLDSSSERFWSGSRNGKLLLQRCRKTGRYQWYPRAHSLYAPFEEPEWVEASGKGVLFTYSEIHRGPGSKSRPYNCALVQLDEGVLFLSTVRGVLSSDLRIGMRLKVVFEALNDELMIPVFMPLGEQDASDTP